MMKPVDASSVLVTGAFGNLGQMVLAELKARGYRVHAMDLDTPGNRKQAERISALYDRVSWGDIRTIDFNTVVGDVVAVIHLAALLPPATETMPELAEAVNVGATFDLIGAIETTSNKPLLVYPSSVTVFGEPQGQCLRRTDEPVCPTDNYTRHKVAVEDRLARGQLPWSVLRVGVSVDARTLAADPGTLKQLFNVAADNPLEYVHPKDVAIAMVNCIGNADAVGKVLLLGGGEGCRITQHEFLSAALEALGIKLPREMLGGDSFYTHWMDTAESQRILQFQHHSFTDYKREMKRRLGWLKPLAAPAAPLVRWGLRQWLKST